MNYDFLDSIPKGIKLVAVSKTHPIETIQQAYNKGLRVFGESKPQEFFNKYNELPKDIEWHFIGHLQTNKVKFVVPFVELIHSVDSAKLLIEINKEAEKQNRVIKCLLQVHIADEKSKFGFEIDELQKYLATKEFRNFKFVKIVGLMGIATFTDNTEQVRNEFHTIKNVFNNLKTTIFASDSEFCELSTGMSDDYEIAISEGSTIIRVGSLIFGERDYF